MTRRAMLGALAALAFSVEVRAEPRARGLQVSRIHVDVSRLRARRGDPTARWVAETAPSSIARALGRRFAQGAPGGAVLNVHIDDVRLQTMRTGTAPRAVDEITGFVFAQRARGRAPPSQRSAFRPPCSGRRARDVPMRVEANRRRVTVLVNRFAEQIPRELGL